MKRNIHFIAKTMCATSVESVDGIIIASGRKKHTVKCVGIMTNNECLRTPVPPSSMLTCNIYSIRQGGAKTILFNLELGGAGVVSKLGAPIVLSNLMPATCNICSIHCLANQSNIVHPC